LREHGTVARQRASNRDENSEGNSAPHDIGYGLHSLHVRFYPTRIYQPV
jgi:hypothetical protein